MPAQVMIMKMHSYATVNGLLQTVHNHSKCVFSQLQEATKSVGGWEKALDEANIKQAEQDLANAVPALHTDSIQSSPANGTPSLPEGSSSSYADAGTANALRKRLAAVVGQSYRSGASEGKENADAEMSQQPEPATFVVSNEPPPQMIAPHPLVNHPNNGIAALAKEYSELQTELTSMGPQYVTWPNNITWKNFAVYQLIPTLVYELEYPRTDRCVWLPDFSVLNRAEQRHQYPAFICF
jgi:sterol O-acyltransferase